MAHRKFHRRETEGGRTADRGAYGRTSHNTTVQKGDAAAHGPSADFIESRLGRALLFAKLYAADLPPLEPPTPAVVVVETEVETVALSGGCSSGPLKSHQPRAGFVYLLACRDFFKIGFARDPKARARAIRNLAGNPVSVLHAVASDDARGAEAFLHHRFWSTHLGPQRLEAAGMLKSRCARLNGAGEWFLLTPEDVAWICAITAFEPAPRSNAFRVRPVFAKGSVA